MTPNRVPALLPACAVLQDIDPLARRRDSQPEPGHIVVPNSEPRWPRALGINRPLRQFGLRHVWLECRTGYHWATTWKPTPGPARKQRTTRTVENAMA